MKLLYQTLLVGATMSLADNLVPIDIMRPSCIRHGKCVNDLGLEDATACCSGVCVDGACMATAEASSILMRTTLAGAPFICKKDTFFGVRSDTEAYFHSGKYTSDCMCPEGLACIIGNGDSPLSSSRFWVGECDPDNHACLPKVQIAVGLEKTLFEAPEPTLDNGPGGPCNSMAMCVDPAASVCQTGCTVHAVEPVAGLTDARCGFDFDIPTPPAMSTNLLTRFTGQTFTGVCTYTGGSRDLDESCVCDSDCSDTNALCFVPVSNSIVSFGLMDMEQTLVDDLSFPGKCLIPPGLGGCSEDCHCLPGSECVDVDDNGTFDICSIPAGSVTACTAGQCTAPATCVTDSAGDMRCKLGGMEECNDPLQCETNECNNGVCTIPAGDSGCTLDEHCITGTHCVANADVTMPSSCLIPPAMDCMNNGDTLGSQCIGAVGAMAGTTCDTSTTPPTACPENEGTVGTPCASTDTPTVNSFDNACTGTCNGATGCSA